MAEGRTVRDWMHSKRPKCRKGHCYLNDLFAIEYIGCYDLMQVTPGFRSSEKWRVLTLIKDLEEYEVEPRWEQAFIDDIAEIKERIDRLKLIEQSPHRHIT